MRRAPARSSHVVLGGLGRSGLGGRLLRDGVHRRLDSLARPVDDRVAGHGEEPRRSGAALGMEAAGGAPDGRERVLCRVLGPPVVSEQPQREAEHRSGKASIELLERDPIAPGDPDDQVGVAGLRRQSEGRGRCMHERHSRTGYERAPGADSRAAHVTVPCACQTRARDWLGAAQTRVDA